jgi:hypothetical protein
VIGCRFTKIAVRGLMVALALSVASARAEKSDPGPKPSQSAAADAAWAQLSSLSADGGAGLGQVAGTPDWMRVAAAAKDFVRKFPDSAQARSARKIGIQAEIRMEEGEPELSRQTIDDAQSYLADGGNPARDRLEVTIAFAQANLRRAAFPSREERLTAHEAHARDLIQAFPDQPEGYGYLLSLAKAETPERARRIAEDLQKGAAPAAYKEGARRVLARLTLEGKPLRLDGAETALRAARGRELIVYSWSLRSDGILDLVMRLSRAGDFRFIGVNLDADVDAAKAAAANSKLPGLQIYDAGGLDGPAARQLELTMESSLYFVDGNGVVTEVDGHWTAEARLAQASRPAEVGK